MKTTTCMALLHKIETGQLKAMMLTIPAEDFEHWERLEEGEEMQTTVDEVRYRILTLLPRPKPAFAIDATILNALAAVVNKTCEQLDIIERTCETIGIDRHEAIKFSRNKKYFDDHGKWKNEAAQLYNEKLMARVTGKED